MNNPIAKFRKSTSSQFEKIIKEYDEAGLNNLEFKLTKLSGQEYYIQIKRL